MKILILIVVCILTLSIFQSCEKMMGNYLDKAPGVDVTEDTVFSSKVQVETFVASMYRYGLHSIFPRNETTYTGSTQGIMAACMTDEAESGVSWNEQSLWNVGNITPNGSTFDYRFNIRFIAVRRANILMQRADAVPGLDPAYINQLKGEARFIRALNYFEMLKRYGGIPIIRKKFEISDNFMVGRNTVKEVIDFIVGDCDTAAMNLPDVYPTNMRGRITKGAALLLKSRTLLYAASPLFNTATPYMSMPDPANNNLICYGNYDVTRWQLAADAAKAVLDWAPAGGIALITNQGIDKNYRYVFEVNDNAEIILANKAFGKTGLWSWPWCAITPATFQPKQGWNMGYSMTFNFLKKYEKQDGTAQTWDPVGGTDVIAKYNELDRRLKQTVAIVGSYFNAANPLISSWVGGDQYNYCFGGEHVMKFIPPSISVTTNEMANDILFRLGEAYLNYAEALNEAQGPVSEAYTAVNTIRARSGQPDLPAGLTQAQFRDRIRNERAIELYGEEQRYGDITRWLIADQDGVMKGDIYGLKTYPNPAPPNFRYEVYRIETRIYTRNEYLLPFRTYEVLKGYLVQNPGW